MRMPSETQADIADYLSETKLVNAFYPINSEVLNEQSNRSIMHWFLIRKNEKDKTCGS